MARKAGMILVLFAWYATTRLNAAQPIRPLAQNPPAAPMNGDSHQHSANFGDLVVTATNMLTGPATDGPDKSKITILLAVTNSGKDVVCASFVARLKTTLGLEYLGVPAPTLTMREMRPGESAKGGYAFDENTRGQPSELILELQGDTTRCKPSSEPSSQDSSIAREIQLDVHDLPGSSASGAQQQGPVRLGPGVVKYPRCVHCPDPQYTAKARDAHLEGTVVLQAIVGTDGNVTNIKVLKGIGLGLDEEAIKAVQNWRFKPAIGPNGDAVPTIVPILVTFRMHR